MSKSKIYGVNKCYSPAEELAWHLRRETDRLSEADKRGLYEVLEAMFHLVVDIADDDEHHASRATVHGLILHAFGDD